MEEWNNAYGCIGGAGRAGVNSCALYGSGKDRGVELP